MDELVKKGAIVDAVKMYFTEDATTSDYGDLKTTGKAAMIDKMEGFVESIARVNSITHHRTMIDTNASASEFTFNFDMKDGSKILWHEVIRRVWNNDGQVVEEEYFQAG